jgi:VanZ family protein
MQKLSRYLLPVCYMTALFCVSSIPGDVMEEAPVFRWVTPDWQNMLHIPAYAGLAFSWWWALETRLATVRPRLIAAFTLTMMYALVDESWQLYIPGRYGSLTDLALNALGAALMLWVVARRPAKYPRQ